jgi:predicted tellurium resistance membrane protein TerC
MFAELFGPEQLVILGQIIFIDLVLAGDNAIIIGMVASKFPVEQRKKVIFWGIGGAVILRINHVDRLFAANNRTKIDRWVTSSLYSLQTLYRCD